MSQFRNLMMTKIGGEPSPLPSGYTECEYLESNGTQLIALPNSSYGVYLVKTSNIADKGISHAIIGWSRGRQRNCIVGYPNRLIWHANASIYDDFVGVKEIEWHIESAFASLRVGEQSVSFNIDGTITNPPTLGLFGTFVNFIGAYLRIHKASYTLFDGTEKWNLIPALDTNGRPCMFDTVSQQSFYNSGTGEFGYITKSGVYVAPV